MRNIRTIPLIMSAVLGASALGWLPVSARGSEVVPQDGWPIQNGNGSEAGFSGSPTFIDLDRDGDLEVIVGGRDAKVHAWHHDGTTVQGWPFVTGSYVTSGVSVGDVNGDNHPEVVFSSNDGNLYVVSHDGLVLSGWPKDICFSTPHTGGSVFNGSPTLADLNGDGALDIVYSSNEEFATYAFDSDGNDLPGWPNFWGEIEFNASVTPVGDLDGDGSPEVVVGTMQTGPPADQNQVYAWHSDGTLVEGWPVILEDDLWSPILTTVLADIDGDQSLDVIAVDSRYVYVLHADGTMHAGWPFAIGPANSYRHRIAIANLDGDDRLEIVTDHGLGMLILDDDGSPMSIFPVPLTDPGHPAVADLDNDGHNEIIGTGTYPNHSVFAWNEDGSLVDGFPLVTEGWVGSTPMIVDLDGDGDLEIAVGDYGSHSSQLHFFVWDLQHLVNPQLMEWPMFQHDQHNSGRFSTHLFIDGFESGDLSAWSATVP